MDGSFISRKSFLLKAAALIALPFAASVLSSCGDSDSAQTPISEYDALLESQKTFAVYEYQKTGEGKVLVKLPNSVFENPNNKLGNFIVLRKTYVDNKLYMENVKVQVISSDDSYKIVEGLNAGDILFQNPVQVAMTMVGKDKAETKKRFLDMLRLKNGG